MFKKIKKLFSNLICKGYYKKKHCIFLKNSIITNSTFAGYNKIGSNTKFLSSKIGKYSYIGHNCFFVETVIGRYCSIAKNVKVITGTHPINMFVSTSPVFFSNTYPFSLYKGKTGRFNEIKYVSENIQCKIGNDVWIGEDVKLMGGITIGDGAIIGAGSIVTKDVLPYTIVVGIPAKIIKYRFEKDIIEEMIKEKWWNYDLDELNKYLELDTVEKINSYFRKT